MSIFNDQAASSALAARLSGAPGAGPDDFGASVAGGIGTALFSIPGSIAVRAGAALPLAFEPIRPTLEGVDGILGTNAAEWLTSWQEAGRRTVARALPRPWELGTAGGLVYGLGVQLPELIAAYHAGGPGLAAVYSGALAKMQRSIELEREGVARDFADQTSDIAGAVMGVSALLPGSFAFGRTAAMRAGTDIAGQAGVNVAAGVAQRSAERGALMPGYPDVAARIEPLGLTEILFDGLLGGGLAAGVHGIAGAARPARDIVRDLSTRTADEVLANRGVQHSHVDVRPGEPRTHVDAEAHIEALVRATEQMARGEQVNVAGIVDMAGFEPIATDPVGAALDGARLEAVRQAEREHAESMGYAGIEEMAPAAGAPQDAPAGRPAKRWTATIATKTGRFANHELELPGETVGPLEYERRARAVFMARLRAAGGIELPEALDIAGERANKLPPGLFHRGGRSIDHHVEWMVEAGYVSRDEVDADVGGGVWRARDLIRQALNGSPVYTPEQAMRAHELASSDEAVLAEAEAGAERAAIKAEGGITEADLEAAGYFDLSPRDQVDVDAWLAYADELGISHEDIDAALDGLSSPGGRQAGEDASRSFAEVEGPDRGDDPPGESAQAGAARIRGGDREGGEVGEPGGGKYSQDVFGAPLPDGAGADSRGAAEPGGPPAGADDVHAAGPVRDPVQVDANTFAATTFARTIGTVAIGVERVTGPEEAAHVFAHLRKFPVEHIAVLTVDAQDRPLALTSIAIGERASTAYDTHAIVGAALRDPRAVGIWVAHNHPSKTDELSSADRTVSIALDALAGSIGVRYHGFLAIAGARFAAVQPGGSAFSGDITPRARNRTVPLQERAFRRNGVLIDKDVDSPVAAIAIGTKVAAGRTGVVLLNHKHFPVAWLTLDAATMTGDGAAGARRSFMSALEASNASAALYVHQGALADVDARAVDALVSNARLAQVRVLDVVSVRDRTTKESGGVPLSRPGAAEPGDMLTRYTNDDILEREQEHMAAAGVDNAKQAEWKRKAEADAQRDAFALTGSDREADVAAARGQGALFEPAPAVYGAPSPLARWFGKSKVVDADGKPLRVYHGAGRPDRIGNKFRKSRATSGPMAFFTDNPDIAGSYAKGKQDTSLTGDELEYSQWFQYRAPGARSSVPIDRAWWSLDADVRAKIAAEAPKLRLDDEGNVIAEDGNRSGNGSYDHEIKQSRGNALRALVEDWLSSGVLFGNEAVFVRVLKAAGFPVERVDFVEQNASTPAVFPVYLRIERPLDTSAIDARTFAALEEAGARKRGGSIGADPWDKNLRSGREWLDALKKDMDEGTSLAWTSIPDWVTSTLRGLGYDGIKDSGGKHGGERHNVWVPFDEGQVKSASGNRGTFDDSTNMVREPAVGYESGPQDYRNFPGTLAVPVPRDVLIAAADARVAEADVAASRGQRALFEPGAEYRDPQDEPVSQRNPTAAKATENPITTRLSVGLASFSADAAAFAHNVGLMARYPNFLRLGVRDPAKRAEAMIRHIVDNLLWLHDSVPAEIRARSRLWYDGAHQIAGQFGEQFGVSRRASAGVIAVMSPQRDWFMNVSLARRVLDVVANRRDFAWSSEMNAASEALRRIDPGVADLIVGKKFSELTGPVARALWIRVYDKAHNSASFDALAPEGDSLGPKKTKSGADAEVQWGSLPTIIKALSIIDDDSRANISAQLGAAHKVRNFYNNIIDPNGADGSVTIDTHAVAAALLRPLSAASREVSHALGGGLAGEVGTKNSSISGSSGTYGLYAEAYRRAARERGLLPRELQSITWEASRGLFSPSSKRNQGALDAAAEAWQNHARGKIDAAGARDDILKAVSGIDEPSWASTPAVRRGDGGGDARAVPGADVLAGADAGPAAPGSAGGRPARVADLTSQDVRDYPGSIDAPIPRDAVLAAADARVAEAEASADLATQAAISCALTVGG